MRDVKWIFPVFGSLILIGVIYFVLYSWENEKLDIEENKIFAVGIVVKSYYIKSRGDFIEYEFAHEGIIYRAHQPTSHQIQNRQCYLVEYSRKNPKHSKMVIEKKRKCN